MQLWGLRVQRGAGSWDGGPAHHSLQRNSWDSARGCDAGTTDTHSPGVGLSIPSQDRGLALSLEDKGGCKARERESGVCSFQAVEDSGTHACEEPSWASTLDLP